MRSSDVVTSAKQNLFSSGSFNPNDRLHVLAAFASRAALEFAGNEAAMCTTTRSVSHHMRVLTSIVEMTLHTTASSEPLLAIAAADALTQSDSVYDSAFKKLLEELTRWSLVLALGETEELCSRLLLLLARDKATILHDLKFVREDNPGRINPVRLDRFLLSLLGNKDFGFISDPSVSQLREFCEDKWINFTHFVRLEKHIDELTLDDLEHAWFFGIAIQCCRNQAVIDGGIVYYHGPLDEPFDRLHLGFFPYQTKARRTTASDNSGLDLAAPPILHPNLPGSALRRVKPRTIVLLMDLQSTTPFSDGRQTRLEIRAAHATTRWTGYADPQRREEEPENFFLNVRGHARSQYPVLGSLDLKPVLDAVLSGQIAPELRAMEATFVDVMRPLDRPAVVPQENKQDSEIQQPPSKKRKTEDEGV